MTAASAEFEGVFRRPGMDATLCDLTLSRTPIANKGATALAAALADLRALRRLGLRECGLEDAGAAAVVAATATCPHLEELDVSWNLLGGAACAALVAALPGADSLRALRLVRAGITDADGSLLCHALAFCPNWRTVDMSGVPSAWCPSVSRICPSCDCLGCGSSPAQPLHNQVGRGQGSISQSHAQWLQPGSADALSVVCTALLFAFLATNKQGLQ